MCIGNGSVIVVLALVEEVGVGVVCVLVVALEVGACAWLQS